MLAYIKGQILETRFNKIIVKNNSNLGYEIIVSPSKFYIKDQEVELFLVEIYQEKKANQLLGFETVEDRNWLENLTKVSGVGPKTAALIIYTHGWEKIKNAINSGDFALFKEVKGLGLKTAKKIVLELKDSIKDLDLDSVSENVTASPTYEKVASSLENMGYLKKEVNILINSLKTKGLWEEDKPVEMIKKCLKELR